MAPPQLISVLGVGQEGCGGQVCPGHSGFGVYTLNRLVILWDCAIILVKPGFQIFTNMIMSILLTSAPCDKL